MHFVYLHGVLSNIVDVFIKLIPTVPDTIFIKIIVFIIIILNKLN